MPYSSILLQLYNFVNYSETTKILIQSFLTTPLVATWLDTSNSQDNDKPRIRKLMKY